MSNSDDDIVKALFRLVQTVATSVPDTEWRRLEAQAKAVYGGDRYYVPRRLDSPEGKARLLGAALAAGVRPMEAFETCGIPKTTGYRMLLRRWAR